MKGRFVLKEKLAKLIKGVALALLYILTYTLFQYFFIVVATVAAVILDADKEGIMNSIGSIMLFSALASLLVYIAIFYLRKKSVNKVICTKNVSFLNVILSFVLAIGFRLLTGVYMIWAEKIPVFKEALETLENVYDFTTMSGLDMIILLGCVVFLAPVFEEILFRGLVFGELKVCMPVWVAIIIQGVLFGVLHGNIIQFVFTTVIGVVLGLIYHKTKNIVITILVHLFFNCSAILEVKDNSTIPITVLIGVMMVVVSVVMIFYTHRNEEYVACD